MFKSSSRGMGNLWNNHMTILMKMKRVRSTLLILFCASFILNACKADLLTRDNDEIDIMTETEEFTLQAGKIEIWWDRWFGAPYKEFMGVHLDKAFGREMFDVLEYIGPNSNFADSVTTSELFYEISRRPAPDLIVFDSRLLPFFVESNYLEPVDIENLLVMQKDILDELRAMAPDRQLYGLPYAENVSALFYNKRIFDEMNVPYPKNGMTWDEVIELGYKIKRTDRWTSFYLDDYALVMSQLSLELLDKETNLVEFDSEAWIEWEQFTQKYSDLREGEQSGGSMGAFTSEKIAMIAGSMFFAYDSGFQSQAKQLQHFDVDWDAVSFPVFDAGQPVAPATQMLILGVPRMALNKDDALTLIRYLLSEPVQIENMRKGFVSLREDTGRLMEEFGAALWPSSPDILSDRPTLKGAYESSLDKFSLKYLHGSGDWRKDEIRDEVVKNYGKRTAVVLDLQERVKEYERLNR